jgi:hypothetical protein
MIVSLMVPTIWGESRIGEPYRLTRETKTTKTPSNIFCLAFYIASDADNYCSTPLV